MVTAKAQLNLRSAQNYFQEHLAVGDYYEQGQKVSGEWIGEGAKRLELSGVVRSEEFLALCGNQHPQTGERLTQRLNSMRRSKGQETANRHIFYDFTFSPPKLVYAELLAGDPEKTLRMHFDTHGVVLKGISLRRIEAALQRRELSSVAVVQEKSHNTVKDGQPLIRSI